MKKITPTIALLLLLLGTGAFGDTIELPLDCAGTYDANTPAWTLDFDLGVTFSEISHVYIDWSGEITAGLAVYYDDPCNPFPKVVGASASLGRNPDFRYVSVLGGEETYPAPEPFDCVSEFELTGPSTWSDLLDGQGSIKISYLSLASSLDWYYIDCGLVVLDDATLIIEGTFVPEPATLFLLGFGGLFLKRARK